MEKPIVRDTFFLRKKADKATPQDLPDVMNLIDTFNAKRDICVGMAANMIGVNKRFIVIDFMNKPLVMINPAITSKSGRYETQEGCLSLSGKRNAVRYEKIAVDYLDLQFKKHTQSFTGFTAQVIQHEIDHCDGILI